MLSTAKGKVRRPITKAQIQETQVRVMSVLFEIGLCTDLERLIAEPDFPFKNLPWPAAVKLTPELFGKALPYLIELKKLTKGVG
jgi:hypothetical protein